MSVLTFMPQGQLTDPGAHALQVGGIRQRHHQGSSQQGPQTVRDQIQQRGDTARQVGLDGLHAERQQAATHRCHQHRTPQTQPLLELAHRQIAEAGIGSHVDDQITPGIEAG